MTKKRDSHEKQNDEVKKLTLFRKAFNFFLISKPIILDRHSYRSRKFGKKVNGFLFMKMEKKSATLKKLLDERKEKEKIATN